MPERLHPGYRKLPAADLTPKDVHDWVAAHEGWKSPSISDIKNGLSTSYRLNARCSIYPKAGKGTIAHSLSRFLVTHVLLTTIYEDYNTAKRVYHDDSLKEAFRKSKTRKQLVWDAGDWTQAHCPNYIGQVYLFRDSILVHCIGENSVFSAHHLSRKGNVPQ